MESWSELMRGRCFVSDLGADQTAQIEGQRTTVGRYAVWAPRRQGDGHCIVEVGTVLAPLLEKYHIPPTRVCRLAGEGD